MISTSQLLVALVCSTSLLVSAQTEAAVAYTPSRGACPDGFSLIREAGAPSNQTLNAGESAYIASRKSHVLPNAWKSYLANVQATKVTLPDYVSSILNGSESNSADTPTLGIATSGGGYRAAIFGAGVLNTLDGRNSSAALVGTGGLLQAATYLTGLSGGAWFVSSLVQADFPTIAELVFGPSNASSPSGFGGWNAEYGITAPTGNTANDTEYIGTLIEEVQGKYEAGFAVTINDVWARSLARHFVNGTDAGNFFDTSVAHGAGITLSSLTNLSTFTSYYQPFPIFVSDLLSPNGNKSNIEALDYVPLTNPVFEFNVYEMGSYDPILAAFTPTKYLGTTNTSSCVTNYDQVSFISGSSSELYNEYNTSLAAFMNSSVWPIIAALNETDPQASVELDVVRYPNAFYGVANGTFIDSNEEYLGLVDGGEDGEIIPLQPLLVKARGVDVIFAIDATADLADNYADGSTLIATQNRTSFFPTAYSFPPVPTNMSEYTAQNITTHPTFFGCSSPASTPLLIYLANGGPPRTGQAPVTNTSTDQLAYEPAEIQAMLDQTFDIATQGLPASTNGNTTSDPEWAACLACAVVDRARNRTGVERSGVCTGCFERYCWNGSSEGLEAKTSGAGKMESRSKVWAALGVAAVAASMAT